MSQSNTRHIVIFEREYISCQDTRLSQAEYDWLLTQELPCFQAKVRDGKIGLHATMYLGVIVLPTGKHIELLPKTARRAIAASDYQETLTTTRRWVMLMMTQLLEDNLRQSQPAVKPINQLASSASPYPLSGEMPFYQQLITPWLAAIAQIEHSGWLGDYVTQQRHQRHLSGKLLLPQQLASMSRHPSKFVCQVSDYTLAHPANRVIKRALAAVRQYDWISDGQYRLITQYMASLSTVAIHHNTDVVTDYHQAQQMLVQAPDYYQRALILSYFLLQPLVGFAQRTLATNTPPQSALALTWVFNMQMCFEQWVGLAVQCQFAQHHYNMQPSAGLLQQQLETHHIKTHVYLRPDIILSQAGHVTHIIDAKWKHITQASQITAADSYQMLAYAQAYFLPLSSQPASPNQQLWLVYPASPDFAQPIMLTYRQVQQKLWLIPFDMSSASLILPSA